MAIRAMLFCLARWLFIDLMALFKDNVLLISSIDLHWLPNYLHHC